jgi:predicted AAA+ superfamily ATPase
MNIDIFNMRNPWRTGRPYEHAWLSRRELEPLAGWMDNPYIVVVTGARQAGKTTLLYMLVQRLLANGVPPADIFYFSVDDPGVTELISNPGDLLQFLQDARSGLRAYVLIDEVQRLPNPGLALKVLYDLGSAIKLVVSGSSSLEIRSTTREHLVGRSRELVLYPLSFSDIVCQSIPAASRSDRDFTAFNRLYGKALVPLFAGFAVWGGYPAVVTAASTTERAEQLRQIYDTYVTRDVSQFLRVGRPDVYNRLVRTLALQVGSQMTWEGLASEVRSSSETVRHYLALLQGTYVCELATPYTRNKLTGLRKTPKAYFVDSGMRNSAMPSLADLDNRTDRGHVVEQVVFQELLKVLPVTDELHYWRSKGSTDEVDFVLTRGDRILPIEVKDTHFSEPSVPRGLARLVNDTHPRHAVVVTRDFVAERAVGTTTVHFVPEGIFLARRDMLVQLLDDTLG